MDALGSEPFRRGASLQILSDIEDKGRDEEQRRAIEEDYSSSDLVENKIISCTLDKEAEDEIDKLTAKFRSCVMKTIYGETRVLHDGTPRVEKGLKLKIAMIVVHHSSIHSNGYRHRPSCQGRKSLILEPMNSRFHRGKTDASKKIQNPQNDLGQSKLPLPPRLREASYRNPLHLSFPRRDLIQLPPPSSIEQLFSPKESSGRNSVQSALSKVVKSQKEISVKLWRSSLDLIRYYGKLKFPLHPCWRPAACGEPRLQFPSHPCWRPAAHGKPKLQWNGCSLNRIKLGQSG
jgi:hypothetical protein